MKTAIQEVMDEIESEHNNGVEISQKQLFKMLLKAKAKEKKQIFNAFNQGFRDGESEITSIKEDVENLANETRQYKYTKEQLIAKKLQYDLKIKEFINKKC